MDVLSRTKKSKSRKRTEKHKSDSDSSDEGGAERKASTLRFGVNMDEDEDFLTVKKRHEVKECSDDVAEEDKEDDEDDVIAMLDDEVRIDTLFVLQLGFLNDIQPFITNFLFA